VYPKLEDVQTEELLPRAMATKAEKMGGFYPDKPLIAYFLKGPSSRCSWLVHWKALGAVVSSCSLFFHVAAGEPRKLEGLVSTSPGTGLALVLTAGDVEDARGGSHMIGSGFPIARARHDDSFVEAF